MSAKWILYKAHASTYELMDEEGHEFLPHWVAPEDIDAILVGNFQGPLNELFHARVELSNDGSLSVDVFPPAVLRRFAVEISAITRSEFAPLDTVLRATGSSISEEHQQEFYDRLALRKQSGFKASSLMQPAAGWRFGWKSSAEVR